jgi:hypothetical protein
MRTISIAVLGILLAVGCSEKYPVVERQGRGEPSTRTAARIQFFLPGDEIGAPEYQELLNALQAEIVSSKVGDILSSGYGMGTMEIVVATNGEESEATIRRIIGDVYPKAKYKIELSPP